MYDELKGYKSWRAAHETAQCDHCDSRMSSVVNFLFPAVATDSFKPRKAFHCTAEQASFFSRVALKPFLLSLDIATAWVELAARTGRN